MRWIDCRSGTKQDGEVLLKDGRNYTSNFNSFGGLLSVILLLLLIESIFFCLNRIKRKIVSFRMETDIHKMNCCWWRTISNDTKKSKQKTKNDCSRLFIYCSVLTTSPMCKCWHLHKHRIYRNGIVCCT